MLSSILALAATGGAAVLGATLGARFGELPRAPSRPARRVALGLLTFLALVTYVVPWTGWQDTAETFTRDFDQNLTRVPVASVLVRDDDVFRREVLDATKSAFVAGGWPRADRALMWLVDRRFPDIAAEALFADDAHLVAYGATIPAVLRRLQSEPAACAALLHHNWWPSYPLANAELTISSAALIEAYHAAIAPRLGRPVQLWDPQRAEAEAEPLVAKLAVGATAIAPAELRALREPVLASDAAFCAGVTALYYNALALPEHEAAAALRVILATVGSGQWTNIRDAAFGGGKRSPLDFRIEFGLRQPADLSWLVSFLPIVILIPIAILLYRTARLRSARIPHGTRRSWGTRAALLVSGTILLASLWDLLWAAAEYRMLFAAWTAGEYKTVEGVVRDYHRLVDGDVSFRVGDEWFQLSDRFATSGYNYAAWHNGQIHDGNYVRLADVPRDGRDPFSYFTRHYRGNVIVRWADAEKLFGPAYGGDSLAGSAKAKGAVIWSDGSDDRDRTVAIGEQEPAELAASFRGAGWDVYQLDRLIDDGGPSRNAAVVAAAARRLKRQGYARIVLMGQSAGAWMSLIAAGMSADIDAVIANAPATYGNGSRKSKNGSELYTILNRVTRARIMLSFFDDDDYDPGGRTQPSDEILTRHRIAHLIIDRPLELSGHGSGSSGLFARRFAHCALALAGPGPVPALDRCTDVSWGRAPSKELPPPAKIAALVSRPDGSAGDHYLGRWYGYLRSGQEILFVVSEIEGSTATAAYVIGPAVGSRRGGDVTVREGTLQNGDLVFTGENRLTLTVTPLPDSRHIDTSWTAKDGSRRFHAILRRLDGEAKAPPPQR
jgi:hypothetical protein